MEEEDARVQAEEIKRQVEEEKERRRREEEEEREREEEAARQEIDREKEEMLARLMEQERLLQQALPSGKNSEKQEGDGLSGIYAWNEKLTEDLDKILNWDPEEERRQQERQQERQREEIERREREEKERREREESAKGDLDMDFEMMLSSLVCFFAFRLSVLPYLPRLVPSGPFAPSTFPHLPRFPRLRLPSPASCPLRHLSRGA
jgi:hypothetical protein